MTCQLFIQNICTRKLDRRNLTRGIRRGVKGLDCRCIFGARVEFSFDSIEAFASKLDVFDAVLKGLIYLFIYLFIRFV